MLAAAATGLRLFSLILGGGHDDSRRVSGNDYSRSRVDSVSRGIKIGRAVIWDEIGSLDTNEIIW